MNVTIDLPEIEGYEVLTKGFSYALDGEWITIVLPLRKKRWRAEKGCSYYRVKINGYGPYADRGIDDRLTEHNAYYNSGNYFKSEEAQAMADKIKKLLKEEG